MVDRHARGIAAGLLAVGCLLGVRAEAADFWIVHANVVSPERDAPLRDAHVHVSGDRIVEVSSRLPAPKGARVIDAKGAYLAPGLIDSHVHLAEIPGMLPQHEEAHPELARAARGQIPRSYLYFGFTTVVDLNSTPDFIRPWNARELRPDAWFCGGATLMDGYPSNFMPKPLRYQIMPYFVIEPGHTSDIPDGIDPAAHTPERVVERMKADGAICVKTHFERGFGAERNLPVPALATTRALVRAAHERGMPVLLHANTSEAQAFGLEAGVDGFAHGLWNWNDSAARELTPEVRSILDRVIASKTGWQPTIQVLYGERDLFNEAFLSEPLLTKALPAALLQWYGTSEGRWFRDMMAQAPGVRAMLDAHREGEMDSTAIARVSNAVGYLAKNRGRLLFGSDTPSGPTYANPPGLNGWFEMRRLAAAGMAATQIFRAATIDNASAMALSKELGTVEAGKRANLLLLKDDPTKTIDAYATIHKVILNGRVIERSELAADSR